MDFAVEDSREQSRFRREVREWLAANVSPDLAHTVDPCDMSLAQYELRRELGRRLGAQGWLYPSMPKAFGGGELAAENIVILHDELARIGLALPPENPESEVTALAPLLPNTTLLPPLGWFRSKPSLSLPSFGRELDGRLAFGST